jgi:ABC-type glycerol-3-phosphate transport system substrate-binding protein
MRLIALLSLLTLSACIGFARSDAEGNVEVVTNWGTFTPGSGTAEETPAEDDTAPAE